MKKSVILLTALLFAGIGFAQKFNFEIGFGQNNFKMESINRYYMDSFAFQPHINLLHEHIRTGKQIHFNAAFNPSGLFDVGIYGTYQYGGSKGFPVVTENNYWGFPIVYHRGCLELNTSAFSFGISNTWYISHLLKFQEKESNLNRLHFGVELMAGYGFSKVDFDLYYPTFDEFEPVSSSHTANAFQGQFGLKLEYDFIKNPLLTALGIRGGYQYFRTANVKNKLNQEWVVLGEHPINLDFSGFYFGVYLKLGR